MLSYIAFLYLQEVATSDFFLLNVSQHANFTFFCILLGVDSLHALKILSI